MEVISSIHHKLKIIYSTKQNPHGVNVILLIPILKSLIFPHLENNSQMASSLVARKIFLMQILLKLKLIYLHRQYRNLLEVFDIPLRSSYIFSQYIPFRLKAS